jgi:taurine dioxygenase
MNSDYQIDQQGGPIGANISGIDLNNIDSTAVDFLRKALNEHLVLFFRDQSLDPASLFKLASKFGSPAPYPFVKGLSGFPEVVEVLKRPEDTLNFGGVWHSDTAYLETPAMGALLYGVDIPEQGGDTMFTNMYNVFDSLSAGMQSFLGPQMAINDADNEAIRATRPLSTNKGLRATHPVVRTHPVTKRPLLYINKAHTTRFAGMSERESAPILDFLFERIMQPEFSCRFQWQRGSLAFWDNRACQHYPLNDYQGESRKMLRVSLAGDKPR